MKLNCIFLLFFFSLIACNSKTKTPLVDVKKEQKTLKIYINERVHDDDYEGPTEYYSTENKKYPPENCQLDIEKIQNITKTKIFSLKKEAIYSSYIKYNEQYILIEDEKAYINGKAYHLNMNLEYELAYLCEFSKYRTRINMSLEESDALIEKYLKEKHD